MYLLNATLTLENPPGMSYPVSLILIIIPLQDMRHLYMLSFNEIINFINKS